MENLWCKAQNVMHHHLRWLKSQASVSKYKVKKDLLVKSWGYSNAQQ